MPVLPTDPLPYADFILQRLMQPMSPDGRSGRAVAETEYPILGDRWFWADDNAKILEFLSLPAVWRRHPGEVAQIFRFLASLRRPDGSYRYTKRYAVTPVWVTSQVLPALARRPFPVR